MDLFYQAELGKQPVHISPRIGNPLNNTRHTLPPISHFHSTHEIKSYKSLNNLEFAPQKQELLPNMAIEVSETFVEHGSLLFQHYSSPN